MVIQQPKHGERNPDVIIYKQEKRFCSTDQVRRNQGGWEVTFYQLTIIMKSKKELKNINHIKFLENYW